MLAFLAIRTNDKVGAILFSSKVEKYIPPKKGSPHVWRLIRDIFTYEPERLTTDIGAALKYLNRVVKRHAIVFLISDCVDHGFEKPLRLAARKHELTVIRISDPREEEIPDLGLMNLQDPETGRVVLIDTGSRKLMEQWREYRKGEEARLTGLLGSTGVDLVELRTDGSVVEPLVRLFEKRRKRMV
jgi:uncharacterized protein (DUF58 family)